MRYHTCNLYKLAIVFVLLVTGGCYSDSTIETSWKLEEQGILSAAVSANGKYVLIGNDAGQANLWQLDTEPTRVHSWQHQNKGPEGIRHVALSANDQYALTAEKNSLAWWRVRDGKLLGYWKIPGINSIALSKDGLYGLIGLRDQAQYFSLRTSKKRFSFEHPDFIKTVALSEDGRFAMTGSDNAEARLWSLKDGQMQKQWQFRTKLQLVALSPDGDYALTNPTLGKTQIWTTRNDKLHKTLPPKRVSLTAVTFDEKSRGLITVRMSRRLDSWTLKSGENIRRWLPEKTYSGPVTASILTIKLFDQGKKIISVSSRGLVQIRNNS